MSEEKKVATSEKQELKRGIKLGNFLAKIGVDVKRKIFKEIHESLGGKLRLFVNGAAALDPV
ncbi:MAG TPA: long-chain fatty acid--CoA ligase, partial [Candidatus Copromorpha excrementipullorum]|nr:long-chain fatty acid--CoA ligase [Candidatus Copromorpha excrementipullorum]